MKRLHSILLVVYITTFFIPIAQAQYQQIGHPKKWTLQYPCEAIDPNSGDSLGTFRKGIELEVIESTPNGWIVKYERIQGSPIFACIDVPNLSRHFGMSFGSVSKIIQDFPLLMGLLESPKPWDSRFEEMPEFMLKSPRLWGFTAQEGFLNETGRYEESPSLSLPLWDKGTAHQSDLNPTQTFTMITSHLARLERFFRLERYRLPDPSLDVSAIRDDSKRYVLPNDVVVTVRYQPREYLRMEFESYAYLHEHLDTTPTDPYEIAERMKVKHWSSGGHLFLQGVPMVNQGNRGYCASATLARVLQFYGYPVNMHQLADLSQTAAQYSENERGGTSYKNIIAATRRFCAGTPYRMHQIGSRASSRYDDIYTSIDEGLPILWLVPGHMRLIIGVHPSSHEIVYTDSWGSGHEFKTMGWDQFEAYNQQMWVIRPR